MQKKRALLSSLLLISTTCLMTLAGSNASARNNAPLQQSVPDTPSCITFTDVAGFDYFAEGVHFLSCWGIVNGYATSPPCTTGTPCFVPYANVTRGQLAKMITGAAGLNPPYTGPSHFTDAPPGSTFYDYIELAYTNNIMYESSCIYNPPYPAICYWSPNGNATRAEAARAAVRAAVYQSITPANPTFSDVPTSYSYNGHQYYSDIETAYAREILQGYGDGTFRPGNVVTRGQAAKMIVNARFYHKGVAGYGNFVPYRGSPNLDYGAAFVPPRADLRRIPSGYAKHGKVVNAERYNARLDKLMWTQEAVNWFTYDPDADNTGVEVGLAIDPSGTHPCPAGSWEALGTSTNLPYAYTYYNGYQCGKRILFFRQSVVAYQTYFAESIWNATGSTNSMGRIQGYQFQETCNPSCGGDMTKADMLGHFCYQIGVGIKVCPGGASDDSVWISPGK